MMAYEICPDRVESLCHMSRLYRNNGRPRCAYLVARQGLNIKFPTGRLFIESSEYLWRIQDEIASTAYYVGEWVIGAEMCEKLLSESFLPEQERERVMRNHQLYLNEINKSQHRQLQHRQLQHRQTRERQSQEHALLKRKINKTPYL